MSKPRIVIVGGGFSGVQCARRLARDLPPDRAEIVLFNRENHLVFSPLLAEVVGSSLNPMDVIVPLRQLLPGVFCRTEEVHRVDPQRNEIEYEADDGRLARLPFDHLVLACGNVTNLSVVPGMADHAFALKTVGDAAALRSHIMEQMEKAEVCADPERRRWLLTFIVVGGGFSGVEAAGEINDLARGSAGYFQSFRREDIHVILVHSRDQILPEVSPELREFARRKMEQAGVTILLKARVKVATAEGVGLEGRFIRGGTIVCTVGSSSAPIIERLPMPKEKGRLLTQPDMRLQSASNIWAVGDCARITNRYDGQTAPTTGQFAEREGKQCAENILRALSGKPTRPFYFKQLGELCSIGGHSAVAELFGVSLSGFLAWFAWRGVYLFKLPTWARRFQIGFDWAWLLIFPRDLAHVRTRQTDRVCHAYFQAGDFIIRQGDPPTNFYVIKRGEVEIIRSTPEDPAGQVIAVLGAGSFFGEKALLNNEPRVASVRARTNLEALVMGKNIFSQISNTLEPLRDALAQSLNRRAVDIWKDEPQVHDLLRRTPIRDLLEPVPRPLIAPDATLASVGRAFLEHNHEFFYVSSDGATLEGIVTINDLVRVRSGQSPQGRVREFMTKNPVALTLDDDCAVAHAVIREYRLKSLPVVESKENRKLAGCIRVRRLLAYVFKEEAAGAAGQGA